jgi:hypothetical protein
MDYPPFVAGTPDPLPEGANYRVVNNQGLVQAGALPSSLVTPILMPHMYTPLSFYPVDDMSAIW